METDLTVEVNFTDEKNKINVIKLFENLSDAVAIVDEKVDKDDSNIFNCFQVGMPEASQLSEMFIKDISLYLEKDWNSAIKIDINIVSEIIRGYGRIITNENTLFIEFLISGYDLEIMEFLYPLLYKLGAETVSASASSSYGDTLEFGYKDNEVFYMNINNGEE